MKVLPIPGGGYAVTVTARELAARGLAPDTLDRRETLALLREELPAGAADGAEIQLFPGAREALVLVRPVAETVTVLHLSDLPSVWAVLFRFPGEAAVSLHKLGDTWLLAFYIPQDRPVPSFCRRWPEPAEQTRTRRLLRESSCLFPRRSVRELRSLFPILPG